MSTTTPPPTPAAPTLGDRVKAALDAPLPPELEGSDTILVLIAHPPSIHINTLSQS